MYYANEESDDLIGGSTKAVQHSVKITRIPINTCIKAVFFKLGTRTGHQRKKQNDTGRALAITTVMPLILFKLRLKFQSLS